MINNKDVYDNYVYYCDQINNCAECSGCSWFENESVFEYNNAEKLPMITYEYQDKI